MFTVRDITVVHLLFPEPCPYAAICNTENISSMADEWL